MSAGNQANIVDDEYPNIDSDDDQANPDQDQIKKKVKPNQQSDNKIKQQSTNNSKNLKPMPPGLQFPKPNQGSFPMPFLPGRINFPPPPPTNKKPPPAQKYDKTMQSRQTIKKNYERGPDKISYNDSSWRNDGFNRNDRKNTIYIKNIPKGYNSNEKLTTFFRTYGNIRQIRCNDEKNEAFVKFKRQQDALKFMNSNTKIFNRTYIIFGYQQDIQVPEKAIKQRQSDSMGIHRKPLALQFQQMKTKIEQASLDRYRALLFLQNYIQDQQLKEELKVKIAEQKKFKSTIFKFNQQQANFYSTNLTKQYSWTISSVRQFQAVVPPKKDLIALYVIYGPISSLVSTLMEEESQVSQKQQVQQIPKSEQKSQKEGQNSKIAIALSNKKKVLIKIKFLAPKAAWKMFLDHKNRQQLNSSFIEIEGEQLKSLFNSGKLKVIEDLHYKKPIKPKFQVSSPRDIDIQKQLEYDALNKIEQEKQDLIKEENNESIEKKDAVEIPKQIEEAAQQIEDAKQKE